LLGSRLEPVETKSCARAAYTGVCTHARAAAASAPTTTPRATRRHRARSTRMASRRSMPTPPDDRSTRRARSESKHSSDFCLGCAVEALCPALLCAAVVVDDLVGCQLPVASSPVAARVRHWQPASGIRIPVRPRAVARGTRTSWDRPCRQGGTAADAGYGRTTSGVPFWRRARVSGLGRRRTSIIPLASKEGRESAWSDCLREGGTCRLRARARVSASSVGRMSTRAWT